VSLSPKKP